MMFIFRVRIKIVQTIGTTGFVYFPSKFRVRIDVRFYPIFRLS
ncbi:TPA: hypothetical protein ACGOWF_001677 [Streptococcus suis]